MSLPSNLMEWIDVLYEARQPAAEDERFLEPEPEPEEQEVLDELLAETDIDFLSSGSGRFVFALPTGETVVKVARYGDSNTTDGTAQNEHEYETWQEYQDECDRLLPIREADTDEYKWLVMPLATTLADADVSEEEAESALEEVAESIEDIDAIPDVEVTEQNVVLWNGDPYLCDYGRDDAMDFEDYL